MLVNQTAWCVVRMGEGLANEEDNYKERGALGSVRAEDEPGDERDVVHGQERAAAHLLHSVTVTTVSCHTP